MSDDNKPNSTPEDELADLHQYVSRLESRAVWAENEVAKYLAARSLRLARAFGDLRKAPLSPKSWASLPASVLKALQPLSPELKKIDPRRSEGLRNMMIGRGAGAGAIHHPVAPKTATEGFYQNSVFVLDQYEKIAGLADAGELKQINASAEFFTIRPDDYDHVLKQSKATAFVLDLDYAEANHPLWKGVMSLSNIPISVTAAQCLCTARDMGLALYLFSPANPHRYPLLSDVKPFFHSEIAYK